MDEKKVLTLASSVDAYLKARKLDGYSDKTLYSYKLHLKRLALNLGDGTPIGVIKLEHLRSHLTSLTQVQSQTLQM